MELEAYVAYLSELKTSKKEYADVYNNLSIVLSYSKRHEQALEAANKALKVNPHYVDASVNRSFALSEIGKGEEGFRSFTQLHARSPNDVSVMLPLGIFCMKQGWRKSALDQMRRTMELRPNIPYIMAWTAAAMIETGDVKPGHALLDKAQESYESSGLRSLTQGTDDSFPNLDMFRQWRNPHIDITLHLLLGSFYAQKEEMDNAEKEFLCVHNNFPGNTDAMVGLARVAKSRGLSDDAEALLAKAIALDTNAHRANIDLGQIHMDRQAFTNAIEEFQSAVALRPMFPDYRYHLGSLLLKLGRTKEAISEFERAVSINPRYGMASFHLARACMDNGEAARALSILESGSCSDWPEVKVLAAKARMEARGRPA